MTTWITGYRPPRIAFSLLAIAAIFHLAVSTGYFDIYRNASIGLSLIVAGFTLMMCAWWQFRVQKVAICPTEPTKHLITSGTYRYTRNPMYLGIVLMLIGIALTVGSLPFYASAMLFAVLMDRHFCRYEESKLRTTFGAEYNTYAANVRRWI